MIDRVASFVDDRLAVSRSGRKVLDYIFPDHWSFLLGEIALYAFLYLVVSGVFLTLYFVPSLTEVVYHGSYAPLHNMKMSEAYASTINLSLNVRLGLLMRQSHHWAADIFVGAIVVHMARVFFTGAFRRPREINWMVGATLLALAIINGYMGYSLPDDLMSGTGVRIGFSIVESIPFVGTYLATFLFGGNYPGVAIEERFFILHVLIVPLLILGLLVAHLTMIVRPHHTQFRGPGRREDNVVGTPLWPAYAAKSTGYMLVVVGVMLLLGAVVQINPIWHYGPYFAYRASDASQPDWYVGWLEGALRIFPAWEIHLPGHMIPEQFFPSILLPAVTWAAIYAVPFVDQRLTGDRAAHNLLDDPRDHPHRCAIGVAVLAFYFVLFLAGSDDVLANWLSLTIESAVWFYRIAALVLPLVTYALTWKLCGELRGSKPHPTSSRRHVHIVRRVDGSFVADHTDTDDYGASHHPGVSHTSVTSPAPASASRTAPAPAPAPTPTPTPNR